MNYTWCEYVLEVEIRQLHISEQIHDYYLFCLEHPCEYQAVDGRNRSYWKNGIAM